MAVITVSRGSYSGGKLVAEKVCEKLGYECVAREALLEASAQFNVPEARLVRAVHDAPSVLDRFAFGREKYVAYIQAALVRHVRRDKVVYHGLAGHFLLRGIAHVVKVRVIADWERRLAIVMERDKVGPKEAERILTHDDEQRRKWSQHLYGIDAADPGLYDLVIHLGRIAVDDAADLVCQVARLKGFETTSESQNAMENLALECEVRCRLIELKPYVQVHAEDGTVVVKVTAPVALASVQGQMVREIKSLAEVVPGVRGVRVKTSPGLPYVGND